MLRRNPPFAVACTVALLATSSPAAAQQSHALRGRVIERATSQPIAQATLILGESRRAITNQQGEFEFRGLAPGGYSLMVEALGYSTVFTSLVVNQDVTGEIRMDPAPITLDTLLVQLRRFTLTGRVIDGASSQAAPYVRVALDGFGETRADAAGGFRVRRLAPGEYRLRVEGFGWLPDTTILDLHGDTTVAITLRTDPITDALVQRQLARLDRRARGTFPKVMDRAEIMKSRAPQVAGIVAARLGTTVVNCPGSRLPGCLARGGEPFVYIDDAPVHCGLQVLAGYHNADVQRIELYGTTIRVYTTWYIRRAVEGRQPVAPLTAEPQRFSC